LKIQKQLREKQKERHLFLERKIKDSENEIKRAEKAVETQEAKITITRRLKGN